MISVIFESYNFNPWSTSNVLNVINSTRVKIPFGKNTSEPRPLAWTRKLNWSMDSTKDVENKVDIQQAYYDLLNIDYD